MSPGATVHQQTIITQTQHGDTVCVCERVLDSKVVICDEIFAEFRESVISSDNLREFVAREGRGYHCSDMPKH